MKALRSIIAYGSALALLAACGAPTGEKNTDTTTSGEITVAVDESLKPIIEAEQEVFQSIYPKAKLNMVYTSEFEAMQMVCKDSARIAIVTRELLPEEKTWFDKAKITPRYLPVGWDAIGVIMHKSRKDTVFTTEQLARILDGTYTTWKDINSSNKATPLRVVFDNPQSGAVRYLRDSIMNKKELAAHCYAVHSNPAVIDEVEKDPNAIGLIGVAWISDRDDTLSNSFLKRVTVAELIPKDPIKADATTMKPYQAYVALKQYPLYRKIMIVSREARTGLGTGFASFIASDKGQRIVLKSGLVPATAPVRIISLKNE